MAAHWDIMDPTVPTVSVGDLDPFNEWPEGHVRLVYSAANEHVMKHSSGWAMRNTNNHNVNILKKSCLGVLLCSKDCTPETGIKIHIRPAICDKARKKQRSKSCPNELCDGMLKIHHCHGHGGYPVTHFWRKHDNEVVYFQAKGIHDHPQPEPKGFRQSKHLYNKRKISPIDLLKRKSAVKDKLQLLRTNTKKTTTMPTIKNNMKDQYTENFGEIILTPPMSASSCYSQTYTSEPTQLASSQSATNYAIRPEHIFDLDRPIRPDPSQSLIGFATKHSPASSTSMDDFHHIYDSPQNHFHEYNSTSNIIDASLTRPSPPSLIQNQQMSANYDASNYAFSQSTISQKLQPNEFCATMEIPPHSNDWYTGSSNYSDRLSHPSLPGSVTSTPSPYVQNEQFAPTNAKHCYSASMYSDGTSPSSETNSPPNTLLDLESGTIQPKIHHYYPKFLRHQITKLTDTVNDFDDTFFTMDQTQQQHLQHHQQSSNSQTNNCAYINNDLSVIEYANEFGLLNGSSNENWNFMTTSTDDVYSYGAPANDFDYYTSNQSNNYAY